MSERIGVFGGTFDPPHLGHLIAAQEIHTQLELDRLLFIPAAVPPHKRDRDITPGDLRLEMVRAATEDDPRFDVDDLELRREGPSYTVDTLHELRERQPDVQLFLAIGADQLAELATWKDPEEIAQLAALAAFARSGHPMHEPPHLSVRRIQVPRIDISSTEIRRRARAGEPISYMVAPAVERVITRESLYAR